MGLPETEHNHTNLLRQRAEQALKGKPIELDDLTASDIQYLIHELQVHQAELAIQNEELREVQEELEVSRDMYSNLYNFAPAGYCTINRNDRILESNQTLAALLEVDQKKLIQDTLHNFVVPGDQDKYYLYRNRAFAQQQHQVTEIRLVKKTGGIVYTRLEGMIAQDDNQKLWLMLIDISKQRALQHQLVEQREHERKRLASDLHDGPVQALAAINFSLRGFLLDHPESEIASELEAIQNDLREQIQVLRNFSVELRPPILKHLGLTMAIRSFLESFREKHPQLDVKVRMPSSGLMLPENNSVALYRICQEAITNISKHAKTTATEVKVQLTKDQHQVRLEIQDNGDGFDPPGEWLDFTQEGHLGVLGMYEQAEAIGGQLEIQSGPGKGTHVIVTVPVNHSS